MVAVDGVGRPRPVGTSITPAGPEEEALVQAARARKAEREQLLGDRREQALQIAAEGGFLPKPVLVPSNVPFSPVTMAGSLILAPAELPVGAITSAVGAPFLRFIRILLKNGGLYFVYCGVSAHGVQVFRSGIISPCEMITKV